MAETSIIAFVKALARYKARRDDAAGIVEESIERYANDRSKENKEAVVASMGQALENLFQDKWL
ncbi:hypothetical protein GFB56_12510 [Ensifer sp. T173]|uniref:Uncharacterized protein n=1 Tax=Ensifer canadensis TaxID=555315 RepID=A0AAW4FHN1_9HYPH|nr:hypothetical protein [Ensifer canadensis]MBM3091635.1 hypothetical protein [Ensifer canadensis]UBI74377.1 hypothetical protein J3R84_12840 [Ensifer canadensis]